jgi:hypothetical protein
VITRYPREPPEEETRMERTRGDENMTRNEKKSAIESMAERFIGFDTVEEKTLAAMTMSAYTQGKAAGKEEERAKWEQRLAATVTQ